MKFKEGLWKAVQAQIEEMEAKDLNLTHVSIKYQVRDVIDKQSVGVIEVKLK